MTMQRRTIEVDADRLLDLLYDWRAVYNASTGVSHAFALSALANTIYHFGNSVAEGDWLNENDRIQLILQPATGKES